MVYFYLTLKLRRSKCWESVRTPDGRDKPFRALGAFLFLREGQKKTPGAYPPGSQKEGKKGENIAQ
jgi:hypothetical protein